MSYLILMLTMNDRSIFDPATHHVPCVAHVMNLAIQAMLGRDGIQAPAPDDTITQQEDEMDEQDVYRTSLAQPEDEPEEEESSTTKNPVIKLRRGINKIRYRVLHCILHDVRA